MEYNLRRQLTLFVAENDAKIIETVRTAFNPIQRKLIDCHVTLCREDEIACLEKVIENLNNSNLKAITIQFGKPIRFNEGKGVLLPANANNKAFDELRKQILLGVINNPRQHQPHITLMHPRNAICTNEIFQKICQLQFPSELIFKEIALIEQLNGGVWKTIQTFQLKY